MEFKNEALYRKIEGEYASDPYMARIASFAQEWADIMERNGEVRSHPVTWLAPASAEAAPASAVFAAAWDRL